jgi:hypothetical protein
MFRIEFNFPFSQEKKNQVAIRYETAHFSRAFHGLGPESTKSIPDYIEFQVSDCFWGSSI